MNASLLSRSISSSSVGNPSASADNISDILNPATEVHYEQKSISEAIRVSKHAKILRFCMNPNTEKSLAILSSDGKIIMIDLRLQKKKGKSSKPPHTLDDIIPATGILWDIFHYFVSKFAKLMRRHFVLCK